MRYSLLILFGLTLLLVVFSGCTDRENTAEERNKATILRVHNELEKGNVDIMDEVLAADYIRHCQAMPPELQTLTDKAVFKDFLVEWTESTSDFSDSISHMIAEDNMVAYVSNMSGIHSGPIGDMPATGKPFKVTNIIIQRFDDEGRIAETWVSWDNVAFLRQIGMFPPPPPIEPEG